MDSSNPSSPQQTSTTTGSSTAPVTSSSAPTTSSNHPYTAQALSANEQFDQTTGHMGGWIGELNHPDQFALPKS
ncbi:uncharacterized protein N7487_009640 [Penicillium crustosum]|uniref:uncharacterized protein n=1 Tax=Penicillium crustosum TaxID=36656 RepID=UPI00239CE191|nr:uncharacterized protein N7487_009640 [Penicillium crustosum]KAJ5395337.1 hypothetical protein N7487_009640 [Penicillium crustosum]